MEKRSDCFVGVRVCACAGGQRRWEKENLPWKEHSHAGGGAGRAGAGQAGQEVLGCPRAKAATVLASDAQPRSRVRLAKSWGLGRGNTDQGQPTGGWGAEKKNRGGSSIGIVFEKQNKKQCRAQNSGFLLPDFCVYCFTELFRCAELQPSELLGLTERRRPCCPAWHPTTPRPRAPSVMKQETPL